MKVLEIIFIIEEDKRVFEEYFIFLEGEDYVKWMKEAIGNYNISNNTYAQRRRLVKVKHIHKSEIFAPHFFKASDRYLDTLETFSTKSDYIEFDTLTEKLCKDNTFRKYKGTLKKIRLFIDKIKLNKNTREQCIMKNYIPIEENFEDPNEINILDD